MDASGNVYTTGYFAGTGNFAGAFGTQNLTSSGVGTNAYVLKLYANGASAFALDLGAGSTDAVGTGIALDGSGNIYTTGYFAGTGNFGGASAAQNLASSGAGNNAYVSKLNAKGQYVFAVTLGAGSSDAEGNAIAVDGLGNVYTTGNFSGTGNFAGVSGSDTLASSNGSDTNAYVSKLSTTGQYLFAVDLGAGSADAAGNAIAVDGEGNVYTTGYFTGLGNFSGSSNSDYLNSSGGSNAYVSELSASGQYLSVTNLGWGSSASGNGIAVNGLGELYTIGSFTGLGDFSGAAGSPDLNSSYAGANSSIFLSQQLQQPVPLFIAPTTLVNWTQGLAGYSQTITASGGTGTVTLSMTGGALPTGLKFNSTTGVISGTPTAAGTYSFEITATDGVGDTAAEIYSITISAPLSVTTSALSGWDKNETGYNQVLAVAGGTGPLTFSVKSGLPAGLTINSNTGAITGTPTTTGTFKFTVVVTDSLGSSTSKALSIVIGTLPSITTSSLTNWDVNLANYKQTLAATGGTGKLTYSLSAPNTLPTGLSLSTTGVITGTPTATGSFTFTIVVTDTVGGTATHSYTVIINSISISTTTLVNWDKSFAGYKQTIAASGSTGALKYSIKSGTSLPAGLSINSSTGVISGTPSTAATYNFTVVVTDILGGTATQAYKVVISAEPSITTTTLSNWDTNSGNYSQTVAVRGGTGALTYSIKSGTSLPTGLGISSSTGAITGTPSVAGKYTFTVVVTDSIGASVSKAFTVVISLPSFTTTALPNATVNKSYSETVVATGGSGGFTYSLQSGSNLPTGLSLSTSGVITGTPSAEGTTTFYIVATDAEGITVTEKLSIDVT